MVTFRKFGEGGGGGGGGGRGGVRGGGKREVSGADTFRDWFKKQTPCKMAAIIDINQ